jgi:hypothetical protein
LTGLKIRFCLEENCNTWTSADGAVPKWVRTTPFAKPGKCKIKKPFQNSEHYEVKEPQPAFSEYEKSHFC